MVLQEPSARIAVTHDSQWIAMLKSLEGVWNFFLSCTFFDRRHLGTTMDAGAPGESS